MKYDSLSSGLFVIAVGFVWGPGLGLAGEDQPSTCPATDVQIAALVRDLGDASYEKRVFATRRLCAIGAKARDRLLAAEQGDDIETALRARQLLNVLDRLFFAGTEVSLAFSKASIRWDEAVDLRITMTNRFGFPARVPFELDPMRRAEAGAEAFQVADMLDVAEWLEVRDRDGREIEIRVDDIMADAAVTAAVQKRLNGGPVSTLKPGQEVLMTVRAFNRGWARYRFLDSGEYTAVLAYVPNWEDEMLAAERVGRVVSNKARIMVTSSAPATVSRGSAVASVTLVREQEELVARLVNRTDQVMLANTDFGPSAPFAEGRWVYRLGVVVREVPIVAEPGASWYDFDETRLVSVEPGSKVELARIGIGELHELLAGAGADVLGDQWTVHFGYSNVCDRQWQSRQGPALLGNEKAPAIFREPLSRLTLSARHASNSLTAPKPR